MSTSAGRAPMNCSTEENENSFEPPMNTDEHRLKADKTKIDFQNIPPFLMHFSVFIGVHRWLKNLSHDRLNLEISVDAFVGACDASVCP
jgi:hypothetical protein